MNLLVNASARDNIEAGRHAILALPRGWVLAHIETAAEPLLQLNEEWEWRRLLELYQLLNIDLMRRLAMRALAHADPEIREAGHDFLGQKSVQPNRHNA